MELYFHLPSKLAQEITLLACMWEVHVFILVATLTILTMFFFVVFLSPSRLILGYCLKVGGSHFLAN